MSKQEKTSLLDTKNEFQATDVFGANYKDITNPTKQKEHEKHVGANDPTTNMKFEEFNLSTPAYVSPPPQNNSTSTYILPPVSVVPLDDTNNPFNQPPPNEFAPTQQIPIEQKDYHIWNVQYYSFLFNVDTKQVGHRVIRALSPFPPTFFDVIAANPDMYGPFWIATTMVFLLAATGNVASYFMHLRNSGSSTSWKFDIDKLSEAVGVIYGFITVIPLLLWGFCRYRKIPLRLMDILCIYGYSFVVYIPISFLSVIPVTWIKWVMFGIATIISTSLIITNFFNVLKTNVFVAVIVVLILGSLHVGFGLTCVLYFFNGASGN